VDQFNATVIVIPSVAICVDFCEVVVLLLPALQSLCSDIFIAHMFISQIMQIALPFSLLY